jgi:NAD(P)-dependent dehydrogenase (short-subunit alcohol dehydrogenase family)
MSVVMIPADPFFDLTGRVAIVTGAADGIGAAIAKRFAAAGGIVIGADIHDIAWAGADKLAAREQCDVSIEADVRTLVQRTAQAFGHLLVLVNNAGIYRPGTVRDMDAAGLDTQLGVNFKGAVWTIKHAAGIIEENGSIVNISSYAGSRGVLGLAGYGASKAALESYTRVAAIELADRHIRVNCISPGTIHTELNDNEHGRAEMRAATILQPLNRVGQPGEVAALAHFLASPDCSLITGQAIALDGGKSAGISRAVQHLVASAVSPSGPDSHGQ